MLASDILTRARIVLQDETPTRWLNDELLLWLSDAMREIATVLPECYVVTQNVLVEANSLRQSLPATATRLFDITRNMGAAGTSPGAIIRLVDRQVLDHADPDWPNATGSAVEHYLYDFKQPLKYMVYPQLTADAYVEMVHSAMPPAVTALGDTIPIQDIYSATLVDGVLFRAFGKDAEFGNIEMAKAYKALFDSRLASFVSVTAQHTPADTSGGSQA